MIANHDSHTPVYVALSGGVDSAVAACLLRDTFDTVIGISHRHWPESRCCTTECLDRCREQCRSLGIPYHSVDCIVEFTQGIVEDFVARYEEGVTPNPCVLCNATIRFDLMLRKHFQKEGKAPSRYLLATGHYARVKNVDGRYVLQKGVDPEKDQSYMLYRLTQEELARVIFPLGDKTKREVRAIAEARQLASAKTGDSQDVCFVSGRYQEFIDQYTGKQREKGPIMSRDGRRLGEHPGTLYFTRGQRSGLKLGGGPWYVLDTDPRSNTLIVGAREDLDQTRFEIRHGNWMGPEPSNDFSCAVQLRYRGREQACRVQRLATDHFAVHLESPSPDICPGQSAVFYRGDDLVGGGIIMKETAF